MPRKNTSEVDYKILLSPNSPILHFPVTTKPILKSQQETVRLYDISNRENVHGMIVWTNSRRRQKKLCREPGNSEEAAKMTKQFRYGMVLFHSQPAVFSHMPFTSNGLGKLCMAHLYPGKQPTNQAATQIQSYSDGGQWGEVGVGAGGGG